jgi:cytochrome c oxidase subunit 2
MDQKSATTTLIVLIIFLLLLAIGIIAKGYLLLKKEELKSFSNKFNEYQPHLLIFSGAILLSSTIVATYYSSQKFLPMPAASPATHVVPLFYTTTIITGITFFLTQILLFVFAFKYRNKPGQQATYTIGKLKFELIWTIIPFITFLFLFIWGQIVWAKIIPKKDNNAIEIEVFAEQFAWRVRYAGADHKLGRSDFRLINNSNDLGIDIADPASADDFIPLQMHVPKNRTVKLTLRAKDVIHSFFIPYFRIKMDAVPGMTTQMQFTPIISTAEMRHKLKRPTFDYEVACAELCGRMHFGMKMIMVVDESQQFDQWYAAQQPWMEDQEASNQIQYKAPHTK